jgi:outer membrane protein OmpA-like peptidoglycan-associated protein
MAIGSSFRRPGDEDLEKMDKSTWPDTSGSKVQQDSSLTSAGGGGFGKAARDTMEARQRAAADKQAEGEPPPEVDTYGTTAPADSAEKKSEALLSDPKWAESDTLFQQEAEVSVKVALPEGKEHLTRIQAELFAKTAIGRESISKAEGHADSSGRAAIVLPVYKPQGHKDGVVEYFVEFVHKLAKAMTTENLMRKVSETALKSADHVLVPGISFPKDSSFIGPQAADGFRKVESKLKEWDAKDSKKAKVVVFGHADLDEKNAKALSERRAQSAYAFIANDSAIWEKLYGIEKWGLSTLQTILKDLGHYHGTPDGKDGLKTQEAFKAIQNKTGLPATGKEDSATRQAIFSAYMKGKHDIKIEASRFRQVAGNPWMGCASNNHAKEGDAPATENRRVAFILIKESKFFPVHFPCQDASEAACQGQCKKAGKRSGVGIKCAFYDELVQEEVQTPIAEAPKTEDKPGTFDRISFDGYAGKGYVIKDFEKFKDAAIQLDPVEIRDPAGEIPADFNNQCVSFVRYFGLPQTKTWKKGPRVCDFKPGELPKGTVIATLRDGTYYSDSSGRSHVGIYIKHDDYQSYLESKAPGSAVVMMDQYHKAPIRIREKKYAVNADEEGKPAKKTWSDLKGTVHENRVKWVDDGEEYFVVLTEP